MQRVLWSLEKADLRTWQAFYYCPVAKRLLTENEVLAVSSGITRVVAKQYIVSTTSVHK